MFPPYVLAVIPEPALFASVAADLAEIGIRTLRICDPKDPRVSEQRFAPNVVLCDADETDWREVLHSFGQNPERPIVFLARQADEHMWIEVLDAGGFDLLEKPYRSKDLRWVIETALKHAGRATPHSRLLHPTVAA